MVDYLDYMMFVLFCNQNGIGPEHHEEKEDERHNKQHKGVVTLVILEVAAEVIVWIQQCEYRSAIDG